MNLAEQYIEKQISTLKKIKDIPDFRPGDVVKVHNKIIDESNERIQMFEGVCIARTNSKLGSTFKVKKISCGMCFEKTFHRFANLDNMWERTISVSTAGKTFNCTGWKVGWAVG